MKKVLIVSGSGIALLAASLMMSGSARAYDDYGGDGYGDGSSGYSDGAYGNDGYGYGYNSLDNGGDYATSEGGRWHKKYKRKPGSDSAPYASGEHHGHYGYGDGRYDHAPYRPHQYYDHFRDRHHSEAAEHDGRAHDHRWDR